MWVDGAERNLSRDPEAMNVTYRVEITGAEALPEAAKQVIAETAAGHELSRVGQQLFVVAGFTERTTADRLAEALRMADGSLEINVVEVTNP